MLPQQFFASNSDNLDDWFRRLEQDLAPVIGDRTPLSVDAAKDPNEQLKNSPLSWLFDNPIINFIMKLNPLPVVMEAFTESFGEEFGDDFKVPNLGQFAQRAAEALSKVFHKEIDVLLDLFQRLWNRIQSVARNPAKVQENLKGAFQDIAHALFDTVENIMKGLWQFMIEMFGFVVTFIEGIWKIPLLTDFFEWFTDQVCLSYIHEPSYCPFQNDTDVFQEFSILNAITFVVVRVFGLIVGEDNVPEYLDFEDTGKILNETAKTFSVHRQLTSHCSKSLCFRPLKARLMSKGSLCNPK